MFILLHCRDASSGWTDPAGAMKTGSQASQITHPEWRTAWKFWVRDDLLVKFEIFIEVGNIFLNFNIFIQNIYINK